MYLLICSKYQLARFELMFKYASTSYQTLSLFDIEFDSAIISLVETRIINYAQVVVSSMLIAKHLSQLFKQNNTINYIAVGQATGEYLIANGVENVTYPTHNSGLRAVFEAGLIKSDSTVMYLTCYKDDNSSLINNSIKLDVFPIYRHIPIAAASDEIKNIILQQSLKGIIITSKKFVSELFDIGLKLGLENTLIAQSYIVIHENIKDKLIELGVQKIQLSRDINQIAELLG